MCFSFNDTATTEIYTLSLHDALPISCRSNNRRSRAAGPWASRGRRCRCAGWSRECDRCGCRSEEHTSELQSHSDLVCRLLLEKKKDSPRGPCPGLSQAFHSASAASQL